MSCNRSYEEQWPAAKEALCLHPPYPRRRMVYLGPSRLALSYLETIGFALPPNENPAGGWALTLLCACRAMDIMPCARLNGRGQACLHCAVHACIALSPQLAPNLPPPRTPPPPDFAMDVIAGSVPRADGAPFQPADLITLWTSHGRNWVQLHSKLAAKGAQPVSSPAMLSCAMRMCRPWHPNC